LKVGRLEGWKVGRLEGWKVGRSTLQASQRAIRRLDDLPWLNPAEASEVARLAGSLIARAAR
jgi:hypothetical protein